jgi:hypothetical protein
MYGDFTEFMENGGIYYDSSVYVSTFLFHHFYVVESRFAGTRILVYSVGIDFLGQLVTGPCILL